MEYLGTARLSKSVEVNLLTMSFILFTLIHYHILFSFKVSKLHTVRKLFFFCLSVITRTQLFIIIFIIVLV